MTKEICVQMKTGTIIKTYCLGRTRCFTEIILNQEGLKRVKVVSERYDQKDRKEYKNKSEILEEQEEELSCSGLVEYNDNPEEY